MEMVNAQKNDHLAIARKRMIQEQIVDRGVKDKRVIQAMMQIPRHKFVDEALGQQAYIDAPLNIGHSQTISQPYIVALMTEALDLKGDEAVLEIGTGCGYQTTILSLLSKQVYTIERIKELAMAARKRFKLLGLRNIIMRVGDGSLGWPDALGFNRILMTCAAPGMPEVLYEQLLMDGFMIVPVTRKEGHQDLLRVRKTVEGPKIENLGACRFVKLIGKHGYKNT